MQVDPICEEKDLEGTFYEPEQGDRGFSSDSVTKLTTAKIFKKHIIQASRYCTLPDPH